MAASRMMPRPATRVTFGTSAVSVTEQPCANVARIWRNAPTPPLRANSLPWSPEPRMVPMPRCSAAIALISPSRWRETTLPAHEGQQVVLSMPDADDDRKGELRARDETLGLGREARRHPHQTKIFG